MLLKQAPAFSAAVASEIAFELYGISAAATPLPSERDQNFLLQTPVGDRFVLKVANARESRAVIEAQTRAMTEVAARTGLCPSVLPARGGGSVVSYEKASAAHLVRLLT